MISLLSSAASAAGATDMELRAALDQAAVGGFSPVVALVESGAVDEQVFIESLARELRWTWIESPQHESADGAELKRMIPAGFAVRHQVVPVRFDLDEGEGAQRRLVLACHDPFDLMARQAVARQTELPVRWCLTPRPEILGAIQRLYGVGAETFDALIATGAGGGEDLHLKDEANVIDSDDADASVVKFVNQIILQALVQKATDIHVEPQPDSLRIRYRIDGFLHEAPVPENIKALQASVIARIMVMSKHDIAEKRLPQDGRIHLKAEGQSIDVRVACIPSVEGESISLRLLGQERFTLDRLGLSESHRQKIEAATRSAPLWIKNF